MVSRSAPRAPRVDLGQSGGPRRPYLRPTPAIPPPPRPAPKTSPGPPWRRRTLSRRSGRRRPGTGQERGGEGQQREQRGPFRPANERPGGAPLLAGNREYVIGGSEGIGNGWGRQGTGIRLAPTGPTRSNRPWPNEPANPTPRQTRTPLAATRSGVQEFRQDLHRLGQPGTGTVEEQVARPPDRHPSPARHPSPSSSPSPARRSAPETRRGFAPGEAEAAGRQDDRSGSASAIASSPIRSDFRPGASEHRRPPAWGRTSSGVPNGPAVIGGSQPLQHHHPGPRAGNPPPRGRPRPPSGASGRRSAPRPRPARRAPRQPPDVVARRRPGRGRPATRSTTGAGRPRRRPPPPPAPARAAQTAHWVWVTISLRRQHRQPVVVDGEERQRVGRRRGHLAVDLRRRAPPRRPTAGSAPAARPPRPAGRQAWLRPTSWFPFGAQRGHQLRRRRHSETMRCGLMTPDRIA